MNSSEYFAMSKKLTDQAEKLLTMAKHLQAMGEKMLYQEIPRANKEDWDAEIRREEEERKVNNRLSTIFEEDWEREISISPEPVFKVPVVPARMKVEKWLSSCPTCKSKRCIHRQ